MQTQLTTEQIQTRQQQIKRTIQPQSASGRLSELWIAVSKNKRLPILKSDIIKTAAGIRIEERMPRVDNFIIANDVDTDIAPDFAVTIRAFEMKSKMAVALMAQGVMDCAIIGRDTSKEFNLACGGRNGFLQSVELLDMDLSRCVFTVATQINDPAKNSSDLNGRNVVTQYPEMLQNWATMNNVQFGDIISDDYITGGIEGYRMYDSSVTVIADLVQSGDSLTNNGWQPLGINQKDWRMMLNNSDKKFIDFTSKKLQSIAGVVMESSAILARNDRKMCDDKESALKELSKRLADGARAYGVDPKPRSIGVSWQSGQKSCGDADIFRRPSSRPDAFGP